MASKLVKHVQNLIAGNSASKKSSPNEAGLTPVTTPTISVCEMLFGSPMKKEAKTSLACSSADVSTLHGDKVELPIGFVSTSNEGSPKEVYIKVEPPDKEEKLVREVSNIKQEPTCDANKGGMGYAIGDDKEVINADEFSFKSQECLLIYPFLGTVNVKKASFGLPLCDTGDDFTCLQVITNQLEKTVGRKHIQTITQLDHDSLLPKINVNDVIINFWMSWLSCNSLHNESSKYFFTSQFYTKLMERKGGLHHVSGWVTRRKNFNIFDKSIIYFPIALDKHWSLCVAFSPAKVVDLDSSSTSYGTNEVPVIIHLDSLQLHQSAMIAKNIRMFFSYVWHIINPGSVFKFTKTNYPVICPEGMSFFFTLL